MHTHFLCIDGIYKAFTPYFLTNWNCKKGMERLVWDMKNGKKPKKAKREFNG